MPLALAGKADLVDICTPPQAHMKRAVGHAACAQVLIEKPMAMSAADRDAIVDAAHEFGRKSLRCPQRTLGYDTACCT